MPVAQFSVPVWHGFTGVHAVPALHATQLPALHTMPAPHVVPFPLGPDSIQMGDPVAHDVTPVLQALAGWQLEPAAHDTHVPALQTLSVPQPAPLASALPESLHPMVGEQTVIPA